MVATPVIIVKAKPRLILCVAVMFSLLFHLVTAGWLAAEPRPGWIDRSIRSSGEERRFMVFVPSNLPPDPPVVLCLSGDPRAMLTGVGGGAEWPALARRERFLLVVPAGVNGPGRSRSHGTDDHDALSITSLLDSVVREFSVDPSRIYLAAHGEGGLAAARLLLDPAARFAAAALFSSALPSGLAAGSRGHRPRPLMLVNGTEDPLVPWEQVASRSSGQTVMPARESVAWWVVANRAEPSAPALSMLPDLDPWDGCRIRKAEYRPLMGGAPVVACTVVGGGHAMPSRRHTVEESAAKRRFVGRSCRDAEGALLAWEFMKRFRLSGTP